MGVPVRAAADGEVTFAGQVAGALHVTVLHADGLRTTASFLASIDVVVGQRVHRGDRIGTTAGLLFFSARRGDAYLNPASLFASGPPQVRLVPFDVPPGNGAGGERSAIRQLLGGLGWAGAAVLGAGRAAVGAVGTAAGTATEMSAEALGWLRTHPQLLLLASEELGVLGAPRAAVQLTIASAQAVRAARDIAGRPCTPAGVAFPAPARRRVAVLVAGLGSSSEHGAIDDVHVAALGYARPDVVRFSYGGGRTPETGASVPSSETSHYRPVDTGQDLRLTGRRLADLVEAVAHDQPGVPIDLIAHSQGGLVMRLALLELESRHGRAWLDRLGLVASLATPHGGADLAADGEVLRSIPVAGPVLLNGVLGTFAPGLRADAPSLAQLSTRSDLIHFLDQHPLAAGLHALSVAARGDPIVPVPRARLAGAPEVIVPLAGLQAHDELPGSPAATRELGLALAGAPPTCESLGDALVDQLVGVTISRLEQLG